MIEQELIAFTYTNGPKVRKKTDFHFLDNLGISDIVEYLQLLAIFYDINGSMRNDAGKAFLYSKCYIYFTIVSAFLFMKYRSAVKVKDNLIIMQYSCLDWIRCHYE